MQPPVRDKARQGVPAFPWNAKPVLSFNWGQASFGEEMTALTVVEARPRVLCREIGARDAAAVADLLARGFACERDFWLTALAHIGAHDTPPGMPRYGYMLEHAQRPVGVLLTIYTAMEEDGRPVTRCNVSSWYVEPEYRVFATMLVSCALRHKNVTYLNLTPAPATWPILKAQGYRELFAGKTVAFPALKRRPRGMQVIDVKSTDSVSKDVPAAEWRLLWQHAEYGCISLICHQRDQHHPFVFSRRLLHRVPVALLVYCRSMESFTVCAGALGRHLAMRGIPAVIVHANGPIAGVPGIHLSGQPTFYLGPTPPRQGDLAYSECAMFHV
ncbi:MAG: acyl-CoA acyltransferase [Alphaproteobacteria bacterium]|nr:acyl-CoA acyltransferase [Alphaproteobacteria bacterium]MBV9693888.1 acyl-CoA acyltransferase [Alphaproteobacteria bacterium]